MKAGAVVAAGALLLAGCGLRQSLQPPPGQSLPPAPAMASRPLTADEMLAGPRIARPERAGEPLVRSEVRANDRFDLPPADIRPGRDPVAARHDTAVDQAEDRSAPAPAPPPPEGTDTPS